MVLATPTTDDLALRRPEEADSAVVCTWSTSAAETLRWCSSSEHPVSPERILQWWGPADVEAYVAVDGAGALVAYGEVWLDEDEDEVELARLIVAPTQRGRGVGRRLVAALVERAKETGLASVILRVSPGNPGAVRCYLASGFTRLSAELTAEWNTGQPTQYIWMKYEP